MTARLVIATLLGVLVGYGVSEYLREPPIIMSCDGSHLHAFWGDIAEPEPAASSPAPHAHTASKGKP